MPRGIRGAGWTIVIGTVSDPTALTIAYRRGDKGTINAPLRDIYTLASMLLRVCESVDREYTHKRMSEEILYGVETGTWFE